MTFTQEQAEQIKKQLLQQVEQLPKENKEQIKEHIKKLDKQGLEEFLKQNKIQLSDSDSQEPKLTSQTTEKPVFESIIQGELPCYKLAENNKAIAILEINPLSKGHCIVLPKQKTTIEKLPKSSLTLAQKIAKKIKTKLKPEDIKIETFSFQNYPAINIIPIYKDTPLKKQKAEEDELKKLEKKLKTKKRSPRTTPPTSKKSKSSSSNLPEISFRIP